MHHAKNDNPHSLRLMAAIRAADDEPTAEAFAAAHPLAKSADVDKKHR